MSSTWLEWRWMRAAKLAQRSVRNTMKISMTSIPDFFDNKVNSFEDLFYSLGL